MTDSVLRVMDELVTAVDGVAGKIGNKETRLSPLEGEVRHPNVTSDPVSGVESDEPLFGMQMGVRAS